MSVDDTIRELSGTISQLGLLVSKINEQIGGISSRINITLQTFDDSVSGIAKDANKMTEQVDQTIAQIPGTWAFYVLFFTLLAVLFLLSVLIIINLVLKIQSICRLMRGESSRASTPLHALVQSESKQPLHPAFSYSIRDPGETTSRLRPHIAVEMESEPKRYGIAGPSPGTGFSARTTSTTPIIYHHPPQQTTMAGIEFYGNGKGGGIGQSQSSPSSNSELRGRLGTAAISPRSQQGFSQSILAGIIAAEAPSILPPRPIKRILRL